MSVLNALQRKVPKAQLKPTPLPLAPQINLLLLEETYPQVDLDSEQIEWLMDDPPYWAFCWASGQVLAQYLLQNPELAQNMNCLDFGCGSGVVAIAAAKAKAKTSTALDSDQDALNITKLNAKLNQVSLNYLEDLDQFQNKDDCLLLVADDGDSH